MREPAPAIAAIVPNHATTSQYLAEAISSLAAQEPAIRQIIVLTDIYDDGPAWMRNLAASHAIGTAQWLLLLDADDTIAPGFVAAALPYMQDTDAIDVIVPSGLPLTEAIEQDNYLPYCCLVRRPFWRWLSGHREPSDKGRGLCDWDFWIRVWRSGTKGVALIAPELFKHRERADSMSHSWAPGQFEAMRADLWAKHGISSSGGKQ